MDLASLVNGNPLKDETIPLDLILTEFDEAKSENLVTLPLWMGNQHLLII